ncbi:MAG: hypothetical protein QW728_04055 [Thermoplasmata archaeon]
MIRIPSEQLFSRKISRQALLVMLFTVAAILFLWYLSFQKAGMYYISIILLLVTMLEVWKLRWIRLYLLEFEEEGFVIVDDSDIDKVLRKLIYTNRFFSGISALIQVLGFPAVTIMVFNSGIEITWYRVAIPAGICIFSIYSYISWHRSYPKKLMRIVESNKTSGRVRKEKNLKLRNKNN